MRLPWVSREQYELIERLLEKITAERDAQADRADRAYDNLWMAAGTHPISAVVRKDVAEEAEKVEKYISGLSNEDPTSGMLPDEWLVPNDESVVTN